MSIVCPGHREYHRLEGESLRIARPTGSGQAQATDHQDLTEQQDDGTPRARGGHQRSWRERDGVDVENLCRGVASLAVAPTDDEHTRVPWQQHSRAPPPPRSQNPLNHPRLQRLFQRFLPCSLLGFYRFLF